MQVGEFLVYMAQAQGDERAPTCTSGCAQWLERVELGDVERKRCEELSKGMQQKVQFVAAIIHRPDLLILDEPFSGLDPVNQRLLRDLVLEEHRRGATVLFSTHVMVHAEQLCDHVVMIHRGEKVLDETIAGIRARFDPRSVLFEPLDPGARRRGAGDACPASSAVRRDGAGLGHRARRGADAGDGHPRAGRAALPPARVEVRRPTLEDVFVSIVDGGACGRGRRRRAAAGGAARRRPGGAAMKKILHVAVREFVATVTTKGFIFGILITPAAHGRADRS